MKKLIFPFLFILILVGLITVFKYRLNKDISQPVIIPTPIDSPAPTQGITKSKASLSLFVPYWTLPEDEIDARGFDRVIYFGVKPDEQGISMTDQEKEQLEKFIDAAPGDTKKHLTLRMIDSEENIKILSDSDWQRSIIEQTVSIAEENSMDGVVLDLEISAIPFDSLKKKINSFISSFYDSVKKNKLEFLITIYGDEFYRARPFDMKTISQNADRVMIMAYDMHKAGGNPGPNFPLGGRDKFGYDLNTMIDDFLRVVPAEKIVVIFGLYGYDWEVDEGGKAVSQGKALSFAEIKQKFVEGCELAGCKVARESDSNETRVSYVDGKKKAHVVWFEDMESVAEKKEFLKGKGINSFGYWAYTYF